MKACTGLVACSVLAVILTLGCPVSTKMVVANMTTTALYLELVAPDPCIATTLEYFPVEDLGVWFGKPRLREAKEIRWDKGLCSLRGLIPPETALQVELPRGFFHVTQSVDHLKLSLEGAAGSIHVNGLQLRNHLRSQRDPYVLEYRWD